MAYHRAMEDVERGAGMEMPRHLKSPNFEGYLYPHDYPNNFVVQDYMPLDISGKHYYEFGNNKTEQAARAYYEMIRNAAKRK